MRNLLLILTCATTLFASANLFALDDAQRLAIIKGLKNKGTIGENNKGFLEFREANPKVQSVLDEENASRRQVYDEIAKKEKISSGEVGKQRAIQNGQKAQSGEWIQKENGQWQKK